MLDLALAIEALVPGARYGGSTDGNDSAAYAALRWEDDRPKPSWDEIVAAAPVERRLILKALVVERLTDAQLSTIKDIFRQQPRYEARWYMNSPEHPGYVYADDPDMLALLKVAGADLNKVLAP